MLALLPETLVAPAASALAPAQLAVAWLGRRTHKSCLLRKVRKYIGQDMALASGVNE